MNIDDLMKKLILPILLLIFITGCGCTSNLDYKQTLLDEHNTEYTEENFLMAIQQNDTEVVELFLKAGINPDLEDTVGNRAMYTAITFNSVESMQLLFDYGAEPNFINEWGVNYIHFAGNNKKSCETIKTLVENAVELEYKNNSGSNILDSLYVGFKQHGTDYSEQINCLEELGLTKAN